MTGNSLRDLLPFIWTTVLNIFFYLLLFIIYSFYAQVGLKSCFLHCTDLLGWAMDNRAVYQMSHFKNWHKITRLEFLQYPETLESYGIAAYN